MTYAQMEDKVQRLGYFLHGRGVQRGDPVPLAMPGCAAFCVAMLGVQEAGGAYLELAQTLAPNQSMDVLNRLSALRNHRLLLLLGPEGAQGTQVPVEKLGDAYEVHTLDDTGELLECRDLGLPKPVLPDLSPSDTYMYALTSGTTGRSKIVVQLHGSMLLSQDARQRRFPIEPGQAEAAMVFFLWSAYPVFTVGSICVILPRQAVVDPRVFFQWADNKNIHRALLTPSVADMLTSSQCVAKSITHIQLTGEPVRAGLVRRLRTCFPNAVLENAYSLNETGYVATQLVASPSQGLDPAISDTAFVGCGDSVLPHAAIVIKVGDRIASEGEVGEIHIGGFSVGAGYAGDDAATRKSFYNGPDQPWCSRAFAWFTPGDMGCIRGGVLEVHGRTQDNLRVRGFSLPVTAIIEVLQTHPDVSKAVLAVEDSKLIAFVVSDREVPRADLVQKIQAAGLPNYAIPNRIVAVQALPLEPTSLKLDMKALLAMAVRSADAAADSGLQDLLDRASARSESLKEAVQALAEAWGRLLAPPTLDSDFLTDGGHSLLAFRLLREAQDHASQAALRHLEVLEVQHVFRLRTFKQLAEHMFTTEPKEKEKQEARLERDPDVPVMAGKQATHRQALVAGASCRLPAVPDLESFWDLLKKAGENCRTASESELLEWWSADDLKDTSMVRCQAAFSDKELFAFDASFFGQTGLESELMDPQHRLWLMCLGGPVVPFIPFFLVMGFP